jgi:hypothetical protein
MPRRSAPPRLAVDDPAGVTTEPHAWTFPARFRARAFGWKGTKLATERLKEALAEIKSVHRRDPVLAAEGAVRLIEKLVPAIQDIDSSSGSLGSATNRALDALIPLIAAAGAPRATRAAWLDRLWQAYLDDGYGYLDPLPDRWGELCASPELAGRWADDLAPTLRHAWTTRSRMRGDTAALSCLLAAGRPAEVVALVELLTYRFWPCQRYAVQALVDLGRPEDALRYAESQTSPDDRPHVAVACERILRDLGRTDEAYARYGREAHRASTHLATFRALAKAYPSIPAERLLAELVAESPGEEGKWFATAKELGRYDLAIDLANRSPCDPKTLIRAARDFEEAEPLFALNSALTALRWLCAGHGYDLVGNEVYAAFDHALRAADRAGERDAALRGMATLLAPERGPRNWAGDGLLRLLAGAPRTATVVPR